MTATDTYQYLGSIGEKRLIVITSVLRYDLLVTLFSGRLVAFRQGELGVAMEMAPVFWRPFFDRKTSAYP